MTEFKFDGNWEYEIGIPAFDIIQSKGRDGQSSDDGIIRFEIRDDLSENPDPYPTQIETINYILENQFEIRDKIIERTLSELPRIFKDYYGIDRLSGEDSFMLEFEGEVVDLEDLSYDSVVDLFGIQSVTILIPSKNGSSYYNVSGRCAWDEEHGLNFLIHEDRIITFGDIDGNSFWNAIKDNGTYEEYQNKQKVKPIPKKYKPHPKYNKLKPSHKFANETFEHSLISGRFNKEFKNLVEEGEIDINGKWESQNKSFLETACWFNNNEIVKYLLEKGANIGYAIHQCIGYNDNPEALELILKSGGDINKQDAGGKTILFIKSNELSRYYDFKMQRIKSGRGDKSEYDEKIRELKTEIKKLIDLGCDPNIENVHGFNCYSAAKNLSPQFKKEMESFIRECEGLEENKRFNWKFW